MNMQSIWRQELVDSVNEYCQLIEDLHQVNGEWLDRLAALLPRIHAAISALKASGVEDTLEQDDVDLDKRFELYTRLRRLLGDHDGYALDFDKPEDLGGMSGSLADDFTDIYFDLKRGLKLLEHDHANTGEAIDLWCRSYLWHWGQHLVDAEKHLYDIQVHRRLGHKGFQGQHL